NPAQIVAQHVEITVAGDRGGLILGSARFDQSHCRRGAQAVRHIGPLAYTLERIFDCERSASSKPRMAST
ncbi:MAG TPA: hypothetical protein VFJ59_11120, partial [Pseudolabrys sp.]|nr:hypothetical protein [Pseudolabrys sp.]